MQFSDDPRFWTLLRDALQRVGQTERLNEPEVGRKLWEYMKFIRVWQKALHESKDLYSEAEMAAMLAWRYRIHPSQIEKVRELRVDAFFFGYKLAFRKPDFMVRSIWQLSVPDGQYIAARELQRSSGRHDLDGRPSEERADGFGFSKSNRLWLMLREQDHEQPRMICLKDRKTSLATGDRASEITMLHGWCLESSIKYADLIFSTRVLLLRAARQKKALEDYASEIDICPMGDWADGARQLRLTRRDFTKIVNFLKNGDAI